jgi:hypothetical protein
MRIGCTEATTHIGNSDRALPFDESGNISFEILGPVLSIGGTPVCPFGRQSAGLKPSLPSAPNLRCQTRITRSPGMSS